MLETKLRLQAKPELAPQQGVSKHMSLRVVIFCGVGALLWASLHAVSLSPTPSELAWRGVGFVPFSLSLMVWLCQLHTHQ